MSRTQRILAALGLLLLLPAGALFAAVDLAYFTGEWEGDAVLLEWATGTEVDHAGFNIWRSDENLPVTNGQIDTSRAQKLSSAIIRNPEGACLASGQSYTFTDDALESGVESYFYYLESFPCTGSGSEFEGDQEGRQGGLEIRDPSAPTPTATRTATSAAASRTPTPTPGQQGAASATPTTSSAPAESSATPEPEPTNTTASGSGAATATTSQASATRTATAAATSAAAAASTQPPSSQPTANAAPTQGSQPDAEESSTSLAAASPEAQDDGEESAIAAADSAEPPASGEGVSEEEGASPSTEGDAAGGAEGSTESAEAGSADSPLAPTPSVEIALDSSNPAPGGSSGEGSMSAGLDVATPTVASLLANQSAPQNQELFAQESSSDGLDRIIQGVIAILVLAVVALIGFAGWTYVRR